jgi:uncharacterized protein
MLTIYVDADACPVKEEIYRVASRYELPVLIVAKTLMRVPANARVELVVCAGFGAVDDWIAERAGAGDIVITTDIPLAARCLAKEAHVLSPKGNPFTENDIGSALATRSLMDELRQGGIVRAAPLPWRPKTGRGFCRNSTKPFMPCVGLTHSENSD